MARKDRGQTLVEYVLVLVIFTGVALESWRHLYPTLSAVYGSFSLHRAGPVGMFP